MACVRLEPYKFFTVNEVDSVGPAEGRVLFLSINVDGTKDQSSMTSSDMTTSPQSNLKEAGLDEGRKHTIHFFFRVRGAFSQTLAVMAVDALIAFAGWKSKSMASR